MNKVISLILLIGTVVVGASVVYTHNSMFQASEQGKGNLSSVSEDIHNLRQLDGEWSLSVLRSLVTDSDFDEVASFLPRLRELRVTLASSTNDEDSIPDSLKNRLYRFLNLIESKEETVEQFKTNFAVVRNSQKFLPVAASSLRLLASAARLEETDAAKLVARVRNIADRTSSFSQRPDEGTKLRILTMLSEFEEQAIQYSPELTNALHNYISHSRIILERTLILNNIVKRVLGAEVSDAGAELSTQFKNFSDNLVAEVDSGTADLNKQLLFMVIVLGVLAIIAAIMYGVSVFSFDRKLKVRVAKVTEELEKEVKNNANKFNSGTSIGLVSTICDIITSELGNPVAKLGESLEAIRSSTKGLALFKVKVDKCMHAKSTNAFELINNLKNIGDVLDAMSGDATLHDVPEAINDMQDHISHVKAFTGELRNLVDSDPKPKYWFNVNDVVETAIAKVKGEGLDSNIDIKSKLGTVPNVHVSNEEMQSSLVSIIHNAVDAIQSAGRAKGQILISTKKHNDCVSVSVIDNGKGMDDDTRNCMFEPFFTTKECGANKVSGLGLSIAQRLVTQNDGKIIIESIPGKGTNFSIVLPIKDQLETVADHQRKRSSVGRSIQVR